MSHKSQLARWLNKVLSLKYLNASFLHPFEIRLSTISRDSGLLQGYGRHRKAIEAVDAAFEELTKCQPPLLGRAPEKTLVQGARNKIVDVIYTLHPAREFVAEVKAASKRRTLAEAAFPPVDNSPPGGTRPGSIGGGSGQKAGSIGGGSQTGREYRGRVYFSNICF